MSACAAGLDAARAAGLGFRTVPGSIRLDPTFQRPGTHPAHLTLRMISTMPARFSRPAAYFVLLISASLLTGCRTYGGHGSEEAALSQIEAAHEQFARELKQAKNDLRAAQSAAAGDSALVAAATQLETTVLAHEVLLEEQAEQVEAAREHPGAYRFLHRTLGGMLSDQEMVARQYRMIRNDLRAQADSTFRARSGSAIPRYHVVPPYFERLQNESYIQPAGSVSQSMRMSTPAGAETVPDSATAAPAAQDTASGAGAL